MKLLLDICLTPRWAAPLESLGHTVVHWSQIGDPSAPDHVVMDWAQRNGHVIFTNDLDYGIMLFTTGASSPSVIQMRGDDVRPEAALPALTQALSEAALDLEKGALITVDQRRYRVAILPIQRRG